MPAWPGGPCPACGDEMPPMLIRCASCRTMLNQDLEVDSVEIPLFVPLQELESMVEVQPEGFFLECPHCQRELKVAAKYHGAVVGCKFCNGQFEFDLHNSQPTVLACYADCPECQQFIRIGRKYFGMKVACKHCSGKLQIRTPAGAT